MKSPRDWDKPQVILAVFTGIALVALITAASTSAASFGIYNSAWDGSSKLSAEAEATGSTVTVARSVEEYDSVPPKGTIAFVLSPDKPYNPSARQNLQQFVQNGGTLVIAEDFGSHSNALVQALGVNARFDGHLVRDDRYNYQSPALPVAHNVKNHSYTENVSALTLNHGTAIRTQNGSAIVQSSGYAYLDTTPNSKLDNNETITNHSVVTTHSVGQGQVVLVSDPSIFINSMLERPGNKAFVQNLVSEHENVLLDTSHTSQLPPLMAAVLFIRDSAAAQILLGGSGIFGLIVWGFHAKKVKSRIPNRADPEYRQSQEMNAEAMSSYLQQKHPEWEQDRTERVVTSLQDQYRKE
ncbi:DUF4350 domain-containing protein [Haladaptatus pallidirubidus]|uniref:DUF4350 domain-containing protein n=1 Tax=Haladaptatus pallidirubidus TaxID=1008152 RepID=A0AAV3UHN0_9EURY|nr:DUF4350 domain-containing protein [Haladaptatus pallidirubidus]